MYREWVDRLNIAMSADKVDFHGLLPLVSVALKRSPAPANPLGPEERVTWPIPSPVPRGASLLNAGRGNCFPRSFFARRGASAAASRYNALSHGRRSQDGFSVNFHYLVRICREEVIRNGCHLCPDRCE